MCFDAVLAERMCRTPVEIEIVTQSSRDCEGSGGGLQSFALLEPWPPCREEFWSVSFRKVIPLRLIPNKPNNRTRADRHSIWKQHLSFGRVKLLLSREKQWTSSGQMARQEPRPPKSSAIER